jgi:hypothetical protein
MHRAPARRMARLRQTRSWLEGMISGEPQLAELEPRSSPAMSPRISRWGILTGGVFAQGIAQLAAFFVAYFGAVPSLVNALIHPYEETATPQELGLAAFWFAMLLVSLVVVVLMNRFARYMHQWWLGEVAVRVAAHYDVPWPMISKATRYKPFATPYWPTRNRIVRLHDKRGWLSGEPTIEILVPAKPDRPMVVAVRRGDARLTHERGAHARTEPSGVDPDH